MAKRNLLAQHKSREGDGGYYSFAQVRQIVDNYDKLNFAYTNNQSWAIQGIMTGLRELQSLLEQQEQSFYSLLGLSGPKALIELQNRVDQWNNSGAFRLLDKNVALKINQLMEVEIDSKSLFAGLSKLVESPDVRDYWVSEELNLVSFLNDVFGKGNKGRYSSIAGKGVNAALEVRKENGKVILTQKSGQELSAGMKKKLAVDLNEYSGTTQVEITTKDWDILLRQIVDIVTAGITNSEVIKCLHYEFYNRAEKDYNKWANLYIVQGWLGEVYWNACLSYLFKKKGISLPTGAKYNALGRQMSVDIIVESCGFQVKNWTFKGGVHRSEKTLLLGNFLSTRADLMGSFTGDILAQMFGAISYNKPNEDYPSRIQEYTSFYNSEVAPKAEELTQLTNLFRTRLNKIIEIDNGGLLKEPINNEQQFYNTFWLINDKVIPSSIIIKKLIQEIDSNVGQGLVNFEVTSIEDKGGNVWPQEVNTTALSMANRWRLSYTTEFNIDRLLEEVAKSM